MSSDSSLAPNYSTNPKRLTTAVALSIASGIIILVNSLFWLFFVNTTSIDQMNGFMENMMDDHMIRDNNMMKFHGFMGWMGGGGAVGAGMQGWFGGSPGNGSGSIGGSNLIFTLVIISGITILIGACIMYKKPNSKKIGSIIVIIFSALGLAYGMGFSFIGSIIGIIGGIAGLVEKSSDY